MIASLLAYAAALGLAAAIPGPGVAALVGQSMGRGLKAALFLLAGIILGDVVYLTVAIAGLAAIAKTFASVFLLVKMLGGAYLIYLSVKLWKSTSKATRVETLKERTNLGSFLTGFSVTMGNPKTIVFYLALLPTVLDLTSVDLAQWTLLVGLTVCVLGATLAPLCDHCGAGARDDGQLQCVEQAEPVRVEYHRDNRNGDLGTSCRHLGSENLNSKRQGHLPWRHGPSARLRNARCHFDGHMLNPCRLAHAVLHGAAHVLHHGPGCKLDLQRDHGTLLCDRPGVDVIGADHARQRGFQIGCDNAGVKARGARPRAGCAHSRAPRSTPSAR